MKKIIILGAIILIAFLQYRIWLDPNGIRKAFLLKKDIALQEATNEKAREINKSLHADVEALHKNKNTIEDHARSELGMVKDGETFYKIIDKKEKK